MGTTDLKTFRCRCSGHTCAFIGTEDPTGCCKDCTADNWLWEEGLEFDDSLFNLDCVPEEAKYISRDAGGYINVWTDLPTKYHNHYHASPALLVESASDTLNWLFKFNTKEENAEKRDTEEKCLMSLLQRPNLYPEYQEGVFIKAKTSENIYKIEKRIKNSVLLTRIIPTYFKNIGDVTQTEIARCYHSVEKSPLSKKQMIDLVGEVITNSDDEHYTVLAYKKGGIKIEGLSEVLTAEKLACYEYRTREGKPCYNFKIKEEHK